MFSWNTWVSSMNITVATMVNAYYELATSFYEWGWGQSFHFAQRKVASEEPTIQDCFRRQFWWSQVWLRPDDVPSLRRDLCPELAGAASVALDAVTIFVDPLDGTREYVEERLANVQSLVGVAVGGRSVAGAIGLPFPAGDLGADAAAVYGLAGAGAGAVGARPESCRDASLAAPIVTTGDSKNPLLAAAKAVALEDGGTAVCVGGAGTKILSVAEGACDLAVMHFGTSLWDTAAPEAVR